MGYNPTNPVTGATVDGLTSPTYTLSSDVAPGPNGIQHAVTALGGTQTNVETHSVAKPFTHTFMRPRNLKTLGVPNRDGYYTSNGKNEYKLITRKGVEITSSVAGQPPQILLIETKFSIPAGSALADIPNMKAALSSHLGILWDQSDNFDEIFETGII